MKRFSTIVILFLAALSGSPAMAQNFPVRVTPILTPPYTPFLTDYTDPGAERMTLQIILNDITVPEFRVKLRMTIEGVGITITTNPNYLPAPITLQGGVPELIYGSDIADYFRFSNLVFQGLNPNELQSNGGRLPEGVYRFSFEVLDYNRNTVISNRGSATAWMILNDPPFINLPVNNMKIKPLNPQNIVFQWTPRHRGSPNAAFTTEYDVKLVEIWPAGRNPFDAINTSRPILETTTSTTLLVYGPAETPLVLGRQYALQVRARDTGGRDVFKNNGYSEVISFVYGDECPLPSGLNVDDINTAKARIRWQGNGQNSDYLLRYREKKEGARWFEERTDQSYHNATGLRPGTTYEYQLVGGCDIYESEETTIESFTTLLENPNAFVCADPNTVPPPDGSPPLPALFINDFIYAGGFDVVVNKATGSNGRFSGEGLAVVPWFNSAKVKVTFENIGVNTSYQLTAGEIKSVWDPNSRFLVESEKTLAEGGGKGLESSLGVFEADTLIAMPGIILSVAVHPESGDIMIETRDGAVAIPREEGKTVAITDEAGNGYLVDKDGKVTKTTATDAQLAGARGEREYSTDPDLQVDFKKADQTKYGLDDYLPITIGTVLTQNYQQTENGKYISWKALATGQTDQVAAFAPGNGDITNATFQTGPDAQPLSPSPQNPNTQVLTLTGKTDGMVDELLVYYPNPDTSKSPLVAGKLNLISYDIERKSLVLVSVNGTAALGIGNLQQRLNEIYGQGVVEWTSVQQQNVTVSGIDETNIDDGGSGLLSNYTDDMKKILRAYTDGNTLAENTYYLFLVKNSTSKNKLGYMPRKRQAGFIFVDAHNGRDLTLTMAHELGHGAFHLKHTFSEYSLAQGVTENLMDYPAKTRLDKWQWDYMHNPEAVLGLFEGDEEGALGVWIPVTSLNVRALIDGIRSANRREENNFVSSDFIIDQQYLYKGEVEIKGRAFELLVEHWYYKGRHQINPSEKTIYNHQSKVNTNIIEFNGPILDGSNRPLLKIHVADGDLEDLKDYLFGPVFPISSDQLQVIFPNTNVARIEEVVNIINEYSNEFELNSVSRMSHFLSQIGAETRGLEALRESSNYSAKRIFEIFLQVSRAKNGEGTTYKYCDLISTFDCSDLVSCPTDFNGPHRCTQEPDFYFPLTSGGDPDYQTWLDSPSSIKASYVNTTDLFDYVYSCRMGNRSKSTLDGSTYLGKGFIHLTGREKYERVSDAWNLRYPNDPKQFHETDINLLETDVEIAMKASLVLWAEDGLNEIADGGTDPGTILEVTQSVNGGANGLDDRTTYTNRAALTFNNN